MERGDEKVKAGQCSRAGPNLCILSTSVDIMHELEIRRLSRCRISFG